MQFPSFSQAVVSHLPYRARVLSLPVVKAFTGQSCRGGLPKSFVPLPFSSLLALACAQREKNETVFRGRSSSVSWEGCFTLHWFSLTNWRPATRWAKIGTTHTVKMKTVTDCVYVSKYVNCDFFIAFPTPTPNSRQTWQYMQQQSTKISEEPKGLPIYIYIARAFFTLHPVHIYHLTGEVAHQN